MNHRSLVFFILAGLSISFYSCQDREKNDTNEVDIIPAEKNKEKLIEDDRPMERSRLLALMRENDDLSTFTGNLDKTGIIEEFEGEEGSYTFFAPSNAAYDRIPAMELEAMNNPENMEANRNLMRYYMVEGEMTVDWLLEKIRASEDETYEFRTALGEKIWGSEEDGKIILTDVLGNRAAIVTSNMDEIYGVYHMIDNVLKPEEVKEIN